MHFGETGKIIHSDVSSAQFGTADFLCRGGVQLTCIRRRCHHSFLVTPRQGGGLPFLSLQRGQDRHFTNTVKEQHFHPDLTALFGHKSFVMVQI